MNEPKPTLRREDLPDGNVRVFFNAPILFHADPKGFVTLRPPTAGELWDLGDPRAYLFNDTGQGVPYTDREQLRKWIGRLMVDHEADFIARERDAALGMLIEEVVLDFFTIARRQSKAASALFSQAA